MLFLVCALSTALAGPAEDLAPLSREARQEALREGLAAATERDAKARWMAALAVLSELAAHGVDDPETVRAYLADVFGEDAAARGRALEAARAGGQLDADGDPVVPPRPELEGALGAAGAVPMSPAKAAAVAQYAARWLSVGSVVHESPLTNDVAGVAVPTGLTVEHTRWSRVQGRGSRLIRLRHEKRRLPRKLTRRRPTRLADQP